MPRRDEGAQGITQRTRVKTDLYVATDGSLVDPSGNVVGLTGVQTSAVQSLVGNAWIQTTDGGIHTLSEVQAVATLTATGTAFTGACLFRGIVVRAISGTPQTATVYDNTSATGTPIAVFTIAALGTYFWDGDWATAGSGRGGRRQNSTGVHVVFSGGASRTVDVMVEA